MSQGPTRRRFLNTTATLGSLALTATSYGRVRGANERIGVGFIGYGLIGKRHVLDFKEQPDVACRAVAEVHQGRLQEALDLIGPETKGYRDFRKLLDSKEVQAVVISTPDHWHALQTMLACAAGKDVYVEKPLTLFVREGRWMIEAARRFRRVVQVGTQQRSGKHYQRARDLVRQGRLGKVVSVSMRAVRNIMPGYGSPPDQAPPSELDWELWLGPAPKVAYNPNRCLYHFRWFWDYSGGQMTNLGQHSLDIVDWVLGLDTLRSVVSLGGRFALKDNGQTPDTQDALFEFDGWTASWTHRECARGEVAKYNLEFHGTNGTLGIGRKGFTLTPDPLVPPENTVPQFTGAHPVGGPQPIKGAIPKPRTESIEDTSGDNRAQFVDHVRDFLDCIRSRKQPVSDLESGHRTVTACHLANLSLRLGRKLRWDSVRETIVGDAEAAGWLVRPYRAPWDRELKALGIGDTP
jgi:predicted dehydrogenase